MCSVCVFTFRIFSHSGLNSLIKKYISESSDRINPISLAQNKNSNKMSIGNSHGGNEIQFFSNNDFIKLIPQSLSDGNSKNKQS
jgi:hypothetical protein